MVTPPFPPVRLSFSPPLRETSLSVDFPAPTRPFSVVPSGLATRKPDAPKAGHPNIPSRNLLKRATANRGEGALVFPLLRLSASYRSQLPVLGYRASFRKGLLRKSAHI